MVKFRCDVRIGSGSLTWHQADEADDVGAVEKLSERDALREHRRGIRTHSNTDAEAIARRRQISGLRRGSVS
jgi:hypothetical protein